MSDLFRAAYAGAYDAIYGDKDYAAEVDVVERCFREHGLDATRSVLDLGCGTGSHAVELARRGYEVVGVDRAEDMLERARSKAEEAGLEVPFVLGDIRKLELGRTFDAVVLLFAVLGYQTDNESALATLRSAAGHLRPGGLMLFDVWYGPAVLHVRPAPRFREIHIAGQRILRASEGSLDVRRQLSQVDIRLWRLDGDRVAEESHEQHTMRFFFPLELELLLGQAGLTCRRIAAFPDVEREPDETTWNVLVAARRD